jgi:hypothetical protein
MAFCGRWKLLEREMTVENLNNWKLTKITQRKSLHLFSLTTLTDFHCASVEGIFELIMMKLRSLLLHLFRSVGGGEENETQAFN